uniref:Putative ovule protein n=1 Tax=Solanum chacoense TaxID=4108 RepID=A0A0V0GQ75_SOLCH
MPKLIGPDYLGHHVSWIIMCRHFLHINNPLSYNISDKMMFDYHMFLSAPSLETISLLSSPQ